MVELEANAVASWEAIPRERFSRRLVRGMSNRIQDVIETHAMSSLVVVAIDFGTTYSGWAFSYKSDYERDPLKITAKNIPHSTLSLKVPTCILINSDGTTPDSFGYDAEDRYAEICEKKEQHECNLGKRCTNFMKGGTKQAKISGNLRLCLEPEAASIYCRHLPVSIGTKQEVTSISQFSPGTKYIVLDAGGPVVISKLKSQYLEDYIYLFREFEIKKRNIIQTTRSMTMRFPASLSDLCLEVEETELSELIRQSRFESKVQVLRDKLKIDGAVFNEIFEPTVRKIISHVKYLLTTPSVDGCAAILMVGGFSESSVLQTNVKSTFKHLKVIVPDDAGLAVLKGAVIFGHKPTTITERICRFTYGKNTSHRYSESCKHRMGRVEKDKNGDIRCYDLFDIHVKAGQSIKVDEEQPEAIYTPITDSQTRITAGVYASSSTNPQHTTEDGCKRIGTLIVPISDTSSGRNHEFGISFIFGGTEIVVKVVDKESGEMMLKSVDFLG
ncbi:heat shock 70 kDa protein 12B-like [Ruditapes philippinarum]|uniref:heat shock 70 kDa protein 12B-like n=1 Tax=Ruditapes philippinarum TaxID=129788 RepID=UPI00295A64B5|nr:heat shock 70 kDa protein 12B-like [Ruditapes philippinarum]